MPATDTSLLDSKYPVLHQRFQDDILAVEDFRGDLTIQLKPGRIRDFAKFVKTEPTLQFSVLMDLFGMDYLKVEENHPERFAVVYIFYSLMTHKHLRVKTYLSESEPTTESIHDIYKVSNWLERECWDLFGIDFKGHPNQVRILCHNEFEGHALRKDYPSDQYQRLKNSSTSAGF